MRTIWKLEDADFAHGDSAVLRQLNLRIGEGEFIVVVGMNGSGKSTLLRALGGFVPVARGRREAVPEPSRLVLQNPDAQIVGETVYEDICFCLEQAAVDPTEIPERVRAALARVGLDVRQDEPVEHLSGGQKQLLCIAGAVAAGASQLLMDEPTAMLDPVSKAAVIAAVEQLHQSGSTIVWATQSLDEVGIAGRVIALAEGEIVYDGTPERFFYGERDARFAAESCPCLALGFTPPYAVGLAHRLLQLGHAIAVRPVRGEQLLRTVEDLCR